MVDFVESIKLMSRKMDKLDTTVLEVIFHSLFNNFFSLSEEILK